MQRYAFFVSGDRAYQIANPCGAGGTYQARAICLMPGQRSPAEHDLASESLILIVEGTVELMVNGAAGVLAAGSIARVSQGHWFAIANPGDRLARALVQRTPTPAPSRPRRIVVEIAAA